MKLFGGSFHSEFRDTTIPAFGEFDKSPREAYEGAFRVIRPIKIYEEHLAVEMEYVEGKILGDLVDDQQIPRDQAHKIFDRYCNLAREFGHRMEQQGWTFKELAPIKSGTVWHGKKFPVFSLTKGSLLVSIHESNVLIDANTLNMTLIDFE